MLLRRCLFFFICYFAGSGLSDLSAQCSMATTITQPLCANTNNGVVVVEITGGIAPYGYSLTGAATVTGNSANNIFTIANLPVDTYLLSVTDGSGCTNTATLTIASVSSPMTLNPQIINTCPYSGIDLTVSGGAPPYSYLWSNGLNTEDVHGFSEGIYTVTVTDANGCPQSTEVATPASAEVYLDQLPTYWPLCNGGSDGHMQAYPYGGMEPYTYSWSNGATTAMINGLSAGVYIVTVTDALGCTKARTTTLSQPPPLNLSVKTFFCSSPNSGKISLFISGGSGAYTFLWSDGVTTSQRANLVAGLYTVTVTDSNGCTTTTSANVQPVAPLTVNPVVTYTDCSSATLNPNVVGGAPPYTYDWTFNNGNPLTTVIHTSGTYIVNVTDSGGCPVDAIFNVEFSSIGLCGILQGRVLRDSIQNCLADAAESGLGNWVVQAVGNHTYYGFTDSTGAYQIPVQPGTYNVSAVAPNALWSPCPLPPAVTLTQPDDTISVDDLLIQPVVNCPALKVSIATDRLLRCFGGNYSVTYSNEGTAAAENAYVLIQLDTFLSIQSATVPYVDLGNGLLRFELDRLDIEESGTFEFYALLSCAAGLGQTHCTEAHIYPDNPCLPPNPLWSGASLEVQGSCSDSMRFVIRNAGLGNLTETVNYIVIEDQVMLMQAPVPNLVPGGSLKLAFPANGSTWRMEVQQAAFHPGNSQPSLSVEGCSTTGNFSTGFVSQFPVDDADPWLDIDCTANTGSNDPNDKQGFPAGYGPEHYIRPGTDLEYKIRFQNTGTDTAFNVLVVDTLASWLDPASIQPGPASHPYRFELYGEGILKFHFENILLPDSNVNEAASHGFLQFRISPRPGAPLQTLIENQAGIFFDFNAPVLTNTTFHRLGEQFITSGTWQPRQAGATIVVAPNPFDQQVRLEVKGLATNTSLLLQVFDLQGNNLREMTSSEGVFLLQKGDWPRGIYLFRISQQGRLIGSGKLVTE